MVKIEDESLIKTRDTNEDGKGLVKINMIKKFHHTRVQQDAKI